MLHFQLMQRTLLMILISIVGREGKQGLPQGSSDTSKKKPSLLQTSKKDLRFLSSVTLAIVVTQWLFLSFLDGRRTSLGTREFSVSVKNFLQLPGWQLGTNCSWKDWCQGQPVSLSAFILADLFIHLCQSLSAHTWQCHIPPILPIPTMLRD